MPPPMFPFGMPSGGMPAIPIPPPPAPQQPMADPEEYEIEMAAMAGEMMQQGVFNQPPMMQQFGVQPPYAPPQVPPPVPTIQPKVEEEETVDPYMAAEIASVVHTLTSSQLTYALSAFKVFLEKSPKNAKRFLLNNPQLVYALLHAQYVLGNADTLMLPLNELDTKLAKINRRNREIESQAAGPHDDGRNNESNLMYSTNAAGEHSDDLDSNMDVVPPTEAPKRDSVLREPTGSKSSRRGRRAREEGDLPYRKAPRGKSDKEARAAGHIEDTRAHAEAPVEETVVYTAPPEIQPYSGAAYEQAAFLPQHMPFPMPMAMPIPSQGIQTPRNIEEIMKEVEPAPPVLVEEVLKNTEILTNIQMATVAEMATWPPEQRLQVLSIKLALHLRGISINL